MNKTLKYIACACLTAMAGTALAQQEVEYNENVVVKGTYRPVIDQAEKISFPIRISDSLAPMEYTFHYGIIPTRLHASYQPARIRAARIKGEPATRLYNNYLRLGFGNYWTPLADLYWSSTRDRKKTYGVRVNHLSSWGSLPDYGPNHFGNTAAMLFGKYIVGDDLQLSADMGYEHDHNLYYGGQPGWAANQSTSDYRASYNIAALNLGLHNMELDPNRLGYGADLHLADLWTIYGDNELNLRIDGDIHYGFNLADRYRGVAYLNLGWDFYSQHFTPNGTLPLNYVPLLPLDTTASRTHVVRVNPYADFMLGGLQFHAGLTSGLHSSFEWDPHFYIAPDVVVSRKLMREKLVLSIGATGGADANSLNSIRQVNPYIEPYAPCLVTQHYDFAFHTRWTLSKKLEANAEASYSIRKDDLSFAPVANTSPLIYTPFYINDNRLTIGGDMAFVNDEMITLRAGGHYYHYWLQDPSYPYPMDASGNSPYRLLYRPDWDAFVRADVNYMDRWLLHLETELIGSVEGYYGQLPMRYGVAAEVEYRHNRALSFFLRMDNLAFQRYMLWDRYPSQRALFLVGLTYTIN